MQEFLLCVPALKELKPCKGMGTEVTSGEIRESFTEEVTFGLGLRRWIRFPSAKSDLGSSPQLCTELFFGQLPFQASVSSFGKWGK